MANTNRKENKNKKDSPVKGAIIKDNRTLNIAERKYRLYPEREIVAYAKNTSFEELANHVIPDRDGPWKNKIYVFESKHVTTIGATQLCRKTLRFLEEKSHEYDMDILSVSGGIYGDKLQVVGLVRCYGKKPNFIELYEYLGERIPNNDDNDNYIDDNSKLIIPEDAYNNITPELKKTHELAIKEQDEIFKNSTEEKPFLNSIDNYVPRKLNKVDELAELTYDLRTRDSQIKLNMAYDDFIEIFESCMRYISENEKDNYYAVLRGQATEESFRNVIESYIERNYIRKNRMPDEDKPALMSKIDNALFDLYIIQDLIDDPLITDIKITDPYSIRVRVRGKAYLSNVTFVNDQDYDRFITGISVLNNVDLTVPTQTFTDQQDENYILRFSITAPYITGNKYPIMHIRKLPREKLLGKELIEAGMMDQKIHDYLLDCGKYSTGIVFAGPPGSGKTTILNWFLEMAYESSAEILVIQENNELFAYRKGVMFENVVTNPQRGEQACSLEDLGKMALVAGANVFVIGEAKGGEITSAITLSNSGCRTAITIHSPSAEDTIDKMTDLALRGSPNTTYEQAKRMIKTFQTIVYLEDFKVREISEVVGYDENKKDMVYRTIYRREDEEDDN